jgi:hypothetical protein
MLSGELTCFGVCTRHQPGGAHNGIFANFITLCSMPTQQQRGLFSKLRRHFSHIGSWKPLTNSQDFEAMSDDEAMHYLGFLLATLLGTYIPTSCQCGKPLHLYEHAKNPAVRPGSSDGSAQ